MIEFFQFPYLKQNLVQTLSLLINVHLILQAIDNVNSVEKKLFFFSDPRVDDWLLMKTPFPIIIIFFAYIGLVIFGPKIMKNQSPFNLKWILVPYNFGCVGLSAYMFYEVKTQTCGSRCNTCLLLMVKESTIFTSLLISHFTLPAIFRFISHYLLRGFTLCEKIRQQPVYCLPG